MQNTVHQRIWTPDMGVEFYHAGAGAAVAWTPALPTSDGGVSPEHWYRSDQGLWQDAGITPATNDGDVVGRWEDLSANADHVNQGVAANKPTLQNGVGDLLNGHPVIRNDGINDYLFGTFTTGGALASPFMAIGVVKLNPAAVNDGVDHSWMDSTGVPVGHRMLCGQYSAPAPDAWRMYGSATLSSAPNASNSDWNIWFCLFNGATSQMWHNGISIAGPGNAGIVTPSGITLISQLGGGIPWPGDMAEAIIYETNLSNADKNQVGNYLATRYGLSYTNI